MVKYLLAERWDFMKSSVIDIRSSRLYEVFPKDDSEVDGKAGSIDWASLGVGLVALYLSFMKSFCGDATNS